MTGGVPDQFACDSVVKVGSSAPTSSCLEFSIRTWPQGSGAAIGGASDLAPPPHSLGLLLGRIEHGDGGKFGPLRRRDQRSAQPPRQKWGLAEHLDRNRTRMAEALPLRGLSR
jgi:hypothetical protein